MDGLRQAVGLLTLLPLGRAPEPAQAPGRALVWAPVVGLIIGGLLWLAAEVVLLALPAGAAPLLPAALLVALWAGLTGGLHLDGVCDCCDGLLVTADRERRLEIMRDPRVGSFAVVGAVALLLIKFAAVHGVVLVRALDALVVAPVAARAAMVLAMAALPSARPGGMGDRFREGLDRPRVLAAALMALVVLAAGGTVGLAAGGAALVGAAAVSALAVRRLGGLTGDVYGAIVEVAEGAALVAACLCLGR